MDWDKLRIFHAVAEAGSFTHAGSSLGLSQSAVSRQVGALEDDLGVTLFQRHARGLLLTEQGNLLYTTTKHVFGKLDEARSALLDSKELPRGDLRVTATVGIATKWLLPRMAEFIDAYPEIAVHILIDDAELDLAMREADVAIRMRAPVQNELIQRRLFTVHYGVYASQAYIEKRGQPAAVDQLDKHPLVVYGESAPTEIRNINWLPDLSKRNGHCAPVLRVNNVQGMLVAIESGLGMGLLPRYAAEGSHNLLRILPEAETPNFEVHFVYAESLRHSKRVAVFRDFVLKHAREWQY
jgi:DNA-binding transcriptional LysR family regulator